MWRLLRERATPLGKHCWFRREPRASYWLRGTARKERQTRTNPRPIRRLPSAKEIRIEVGVQNNGGSLSVSTKIEVPQVCLRKDIMKEVTGITIGSITRMVKLEIISVEEARSILREAGLVE